MKRILLFIASAILSVTALAQLTQPPGGITGNMPPWSGGNGTSGQILTSRGVSLAPTFQAAPSGAAGANPSALVGPTATNGVATTFLRSDGAPAIDLTANYTWTGIHTVSSAEPRWKFNETDQGADVKLWDVDVQTGVFCVRTRTDADAAGVNAFCVTRGATTAISNVSVGNATNNPTFTFLGTGSVTVGGSLLGQAAVFSNVLVNGSVPGGPGIYRLSANVLGFSCSTGAACGNIDANKSFNAVAAITSTGTKPTVTGCSNSSTLGGAVAGSYLSGTSGTCTVTITLPTGPTNGYACFAHDDTTAADYTQSAIVTSTTTLTISGTTVSSDKIVWGCLGY